MAQLGILLQKPLQGLHEVRHAIVLGNVPEDSNLLHEDRGVDGEGEVPSTAAVHRHVGFLHTSALQADLKRSSPSQECPTWSHPHLASLTFTLTRNPFQTLLQLYPNMFPL